jgi:hypothetical protein
MFFLSFLLSSLYKTCLALSTTTIAAGALRLAPTALRAVEAAAASTVGKKVTSRVSARTHLAVVVVAAGASVAVADLVIGAALLETAVLASTAGKKATSHASAPNPGLAAVLATTAAKKATSHASARSHPAAAVAGALVTAPEAHPGTVVSVVDAAALVIVAVEVASETAAAAHPATEDSETVAVVASAIVVASGIVVASVDAAALAIVAVEVALETAAAARLASDQDRRLWKKVEKHNGQLEIKYSANFFWLARETISMGSRQLR